MTDLSRFLEGSEIKGFLKGFNVRYVTAQYESVIYLLLLGLRWKVQWQKLRKQLRKNTAGKYMYHRSA